LPTESAWLFSPISRAAFASAGVCRCMYTRWTVKVSRLIFPRLTARPVLGVGLAPAPAVPCALNGAAMSAIADRTIPTRVIRITSVERL
jgi:hypothetical protein